MTGDTNHNVKLAKDSLVEIFLRSSVKSLLRSKVVCKQWHSLITNPEFVLNHLQHQKRNDKGRLLLQFAKEEIQGYSYALFDDETLVSDTYQELDQFELRNQCSLRMNGPINGLYCLFNGHEGIVVWNPSLFEVRPVPLPPPHSFSDVELHDGNIGFGIDTLTHDYKIVLLCSFSDKNSFLLWSIRVHNLTTNAWRVLNLGDLNLTDHEYFCDTENTSFLCGTWYWLTSSNRVIAFDMGQETIRQMSVPDVKFSLSSTGSLTIYYDKVALLLKIDFAVDIWVMLEENIWIKKLSVTSLPKDFWVVCLWKEDGLLVAVDDFYRDTTFQTVLCNASTRGMRSMGPQGRPISFQASVYYESLVSVNFGTEHRGKSESLTTISDYLRR